MKTLERMSSESWDARLAGAMIDMPQLTGRSRPLSLYLSTFTIEMKAQWLTPLRPNNQDVTGDHIHNNFPWGG